MSPVKHTVAGPALSFVLADEMRLVRDELDPSNERSGRTLVKEGPLTVTLVAVNPGGELRPHHAKGPITIHVLEGEIEFHAENQTWTLPAGSLFALNSGVTHAVRSAKGGAFLLTVVTPFSEAGTPV
jgi:quercetin dioxygenase-like cupin family protein